MLSKILVMAAMSPRKLTKEKRLKEVFEEMLEEKVEHKN